MRQNRFLLMFCLMALMLGSIIMLWDGLGTRVAAQAPRLTQTASHTSTPDDTTVTPTDTADSNVTATPTETTEPTRTETPAAPTVTSTPVTYELLQNGSFEVPDPVDSSQALHWVVSKPSKDKRKCKPAKAYEGECFYQFKTGPQEKATLRQSIVSGLFSPEHYLTLYAGYFATGDPKLKIKVVINYASQPPEKTVLKMKGITNGVYQSLISSDIYFASATVASVEVQLLNRGTFGKVRLDELRLVATMIDDAFIPERLSLP